MIVAADADIERPHRLPRGVRSSTPADLRRHRALLRRPDDRRAVHRPRGGDRPRAVAGVLRRHCPESLPGPEWDHDLGPIRTAEHLAEVRELLADAIAQGAVVRCGGAPAAVDDHCFPPTVLTNVHHGMRIMREEVFAPLLPIMPVSNMDEAIALANDTPYGLSASIWTRSRRQARAGRSSSIRVA